MNHAVAIRAKRLEILGPVLRGSRPGQGALMVHFNEVRASVAIDLFEIEPTCKTAQPPEFLPPVRSGQSPQRGVPLNGEVIPELPLSFAKEIRSTRDGIDEGGVEQEPPEPREADR
jgi:hypothetical protein